MKRTIQMILSLFLIVYSFQACKKTPLDSGLSDDRTLIASARSYFEAHLQGLSPLQTSNIRIKAGKQPYWQGAYIITSSKGRAVIVPVFYQKNLVVTTNFSGSRILSLNYLTNLVMYKDSLAFQTQLVTLFPDSTDRTSTNGQFSGIAFMETWQGRPIKKDKLSQGLAFTESAPSTAHDSSKTLSSSAGKETDGLIAVCGTITGYNYSADNPDDIYYWSEPAGCNYEYLPDPMGPGLAPSDFSKFVRRPVAPTTIIIRPPTNIIANVRDYTKCFSNYGGTDHSYQVTVCVDQPVPGSRQAWTPTYSGAASSSFGQNPVDAGHTFLVLTEHFSGYSIVRNIGFYPRTNVFPWASSAQGQLNNDDGHTYNISLSITVDNGQFFNILNYISQGNDPGYMYDLNTNNCTSFVLHALDAGNISLPATIGKWPDGGFGYDPGDLGEDIRNMSLSSNMTRNTNYNDHPNQYTCN